MSGFYTSTDDQYRHYCRDVVDTRMRFSNEDRIEIVREFLEGKLEAKQIAERCQLSSVQVLYQWVGRYIDDSRTFNETDALKDNQFKTLSPDEQLRELKKLRKALELEKLRSEGYRHMIELAEKQFNIPIRKKSGTKQ